ncbi:MAG TPA: 8-amino-7-oxononanoate synthase, partial [Coxiellaceae bacterium]|nr:8-amino-7-oxononanoate synthase [Coxiellaceae bacterium]
MDVILTHNLKTRHLAGLYRTRDLIDGSDYLGLANHTVAAGFSLRFPATQAKACGYHNKSCISFSSNDYLGLANHPKVVRACKNGLEKYGVGSGASQLLGGYSLAHRYLEEELAEFLDYEQVLLFSTGYMANLGILTTLFKRSDSHIFVDRLSHASIIDGCCFSGMHFKRYKHQDMQNLEMLLAQANSKYKLVISDGVFSMDGDLAPLPKLTSIAKQNNTWLMIDDAHGIGVLGVNGKGIMKHYGVATSEVQILVGTFGKAFGTFGAFVAGSKLVIENLIQFARTYIYTTALPAAIVEGTRCSLRLLQSECWRRDHLYNLIKKFKEGARQLNLPLLSSETPIQPLIIGNAEHAQNIASYLKQLGILVALVRPPTVPINTSRLRISLTANHTEKDIDCLLNALESCKLTFLRSGISSPKSGMSFSRSGMSSSGLTRGSLYPIRDPRVKPEGDKSGRRSPHRSARVKEKAILENGNIVLKKGNDIPNKGNVILKRENVILGLDPRISITRSFNRAAKSYNQVNFLQLEVGYRLFCWLKDFADHPKKIADLGCGTGIITAKLAQDFPQSRVLGIDIAENMIEYARSCFTKEKNLNFITADADSLPLENENLDIAFSNLMLQWSPNLKTTLTALWRALKPGGKLIFSTLGPGSLNELRNAWAKIDHYKHVNNFVDREQLTEELMCAQFKILKFETVYHYRLFDTVLDLMHELKKLG